MNSLAQKGNLRISEADRAVVRRPPYLYDPSKDTTDWFDDTTPLELPRMRDPWPNKPMTLTDLSYDYDTEDEEQRDYQRDGQQDYDYEKSVTP